MKVRVYGKSHVKGISAKTGGAYDFSVIHYLGKAHRVEGLAAISVNVDNTLCKYEDIWVGEDYYIEFDNRGVLIEFYRASDVGG